MLPFGELQVTGGFLHKESLLLFSVVITELMKSAREVVSLLLLTLELLFKLIYHLVGHYRTLFAVAASDSEFRVA